VAVRWGFDGHVFCELDDRIYDACIGPHLGTETRSQYIDAAIDTNAHNAKQRRQISMKREMRPYRPKEEKEREERERSAAIGRTLIGEVDLNSPTAPDTHGTEKEIHPFVVITKLL
jgi:hypothetical protein